MNRTPDLDLVLREYLADDGISARDDVLDVVADRISRQPQRRSWPFPWRTTMTTQLKLATAVVAAAIVAVVGWNLLPRGGSNGGTPTPSPTPVLAPTPTASASTSQPTIDVSAGVRHRMTPEAVQEVVLRQIARDEARAGERLVAPRITLVRLMPPGASYSDGVAGMTADTVSWLVVYEGTVLGCGSTCDAFTGAAVMVDDATGDIMSGINSGHVGKCVRTGETSCVITRETPQP
jgi:hypothetical protein